jgi:two-component sensor histidine kinase
MLSLVCGAVIVMLAVATLAGWLSYRGYRDRVASSLVAASSAVMTAVDNELDEPLAFVNGLSSSTAFSEGDFETFGRQARNALSQYRYVLIIQSARGEREYVNTSKSTADQSVSVGAAGPLQLGSAREAYLQRIEGRSMVLIDVPIGDRFGQTPFKMVIGIPNDFFQAVLAAQKLPETWIPAVLDTNWRVVARVPGIETFVGHKGEGEEFRDAPTDQVHKLRLLENVAGIAAHSHSARYGWTTAIAISETNLFSQAFGLVFLSALGGFAATGFVVLLSASLLTYVAGAIKKLADGVHEFPEGTLQQKLTFRLQELSEVAAALQKAGLAVLDSRKQMSAEVEDMKRLNALSTMLVDDQNKFESCLGEITKAAIAISGADKGNMRLFDEATQSLRVIAQHGFKQAFLQYFEKVDDHFAASYGAVMALNQQVIVDDVLTNEIFVGKPSQKVLVDAEVRALVSTPLRSSKGNLLGVISTHYGRPGRPRERQLRLVSILARQAADYLERKHSEQIHQTILGELQHRSNNLLAVVQSIARSSLDGLPEAKKAFEARLQALARANHALLRANWGGVDLHQLVRTELETFTQRASINGLSVLLSPQHAQNFTLALHELATNSAKYGALSKSTGMVEVSWTIEPNRPASILRFTWHERGGPPVNPPVRYGFGTQLLKAVCSDVRLQYAVDGFRYDIAVPLGGTQHSPETVASG